MSLNNPFSAEYASNPKLVLLGLGRQRGRLRLQSTSLLPSFNRRDQISDHAGEVMEDSQSVFTRI